MTEIGEKALALVNEVIGYDIEDVLSDAGLHALYFALCRSIEQHETFKQEVSDAVLSAMKVLLEMAEHDCEVRIRPILERFIIPKPDPIAEAWIEATGNTVGMDPLNAALEARGLEIKEKSK